ncbi:hypothetical protein KLI87_06350 [Actinomadura sp. NEAU-AAG7]|nr:hypothetical protein [Actinomadura sp. NEAU-AAG7]
MRAETPEAAALAEWLRETLTAGLTVRELADRFRFGRAKWAEFRNGADLIPGWLLEQVVTDLVAEPRLRERRLEQGRDLLERAERAAAGKVAVAARGLSEGELLRRLEQAQDGQIVAQQAQLASLRVLFTLLNVVRLLREQNQTLTGQVAAERHGVHRLRRDLAEERLRQARAARDEAEDLMVEGHTQSGQLRQLLHRPERAPAILPGEPPPIAVAWSPEECDQYLDQARDFLQQIWAALDLARDRLRLEPAEDRPASAIVHGQTLDNTPDTDPPQLSSPSHDPRNQPQDLLEDDAEPHRPPPGQVRLPPSAEAHDQARQSREPNTDNPQPAEPPKSADGYQQVREGGEEDTEDYDWFDWAFPAVLIGLFVALFSSLIWYQSYSQTKSLDPGWVVSGARPARVAVSQKRSYAGHTALGYRLTAGQAVSTSFALPRMRNMPLSGGTRFFSAFLDFRPDTGCGAETRLIWTIGKHSGRLRPREDHTLTSEVVTTPITLSARLEAPAPCSGTFRLSLPSVSN